MFSQGQIIFGIGFFIAFVAVMIVMYRKDLKMHHTYYKGSLWVLLALISFVIILFSIKYILKH